MEHRMANQFLRAALIEIDELGDKLSPARAEALLDEFEHDISPKAKIILYGPHRKQHWRKVFLMFSLDP
jgi:hypothetical protein